MGSLSKDKILLAAREEFLSRGFHGARMAQIAKNAGVNKALTHYHYSDKASLYKACFTGLATFGRDDLNQILDYKLNFRDTIRLIAEWHINYLSKSPQIAAFLASEISNNTELAMDTFIYSQGGRRSYFIPKVIELIQSEIQYGHVKHVEPMAFITNLYALILFPFMVVPIMEASFDVDKTSLVKRIQNRSEEIVTTLVDPIFVSEKDYAETVNAMPLYRQKKKSAHAVSQQSVIAQGSGAIAMKESNEQ